MTERAEQRGRWRRYKDGVVSQQKPDHHHHLALSTSINTHSIHQQSSPIMKFAFSLLALALRASAVLASAAPDANAEALSERASLIEECGELGVRSFFHSPESLPEKTNTLSQVMTVPEGADPSKYRKCADHPLGENRRLYETSYGTPDASLVSRAFSSPDKIRGAADIFARKEQACYYDAGLGCSGNYCWKACGNPGDGKWCWTAAGDGGGAWLQCATFNDCKQDAACGKGCVASKACGCGC